MGAALVGLSLHPHQGHLPPSPLKKQKNKKQTNELSMNSSSLRSKRSQRFRAVSEQRKTEEFDPRMSTETLATQARIHHF